jgi:mannose-6-phosphate isomerase-like protein (cupin superfamily)
MVEESYREWNRTHDEIRRHGAMGNLNRGIEITTHGIQTRLIAWPGNGFQTQSVHVLTLRPGDSSASYTYDMAEEAMLCLWGAGEVFLRGAWIGIAAGDIAYFPSNVGHGIRNPGSNKEDLVLVSQICPPQFDLYEEGGYYERARGAMNFAAIEDAKRAARWTSYSGYRCQTPRNIA